jgi:hypothetical protein
MELMQCLEVLEADHARVAVFEAPGDPTHRIHLLDGSGEPIELDADDPKCPLPVLVATGPGGMAAFITRYVEPGRRLPAVSGGLGLVAEAERLRRGGGVARTSGEFGQQRNMLGVHLDDDWVDAMAALEDAFTMSPFMATAAVTQASADLGPVSQQYTAFSASLISVERHTLGRSTTLILDLKYPRYRDEASHLLLRAEGLSAGLPVAADLPIDVLGPLRLIEGGAWGTASGGPATAAWPPPTDTPENDAMHAVFLAPDDVLADVVALAATRCSTSAQTINSIGLVAVARVRLGADPACLAPLVSNRVLDARVRAVADDLMVPAVET